MHHAATEQLQPSHTICETRSLQVVGAAVAVVIGMLVVPSVALASPGPAPSPPPGLKSPPARLTDVELEHFAKVVGEDVDRVRWRLFLDPELAPLANSAVNARANRLGFGTLLTVSGFGAYVLGMLMGGFDAIAHWGWGWQTPGQSKGLGYGSIVALAVAGIGLATGIAGIVVLSRTSETERKAHDRYQSPPPVPALEIAWASSNGSLRGTPKSLAFSVVSIGF
jgi:hypothetical protein